MAVAPPPRRPPLANLPNALSASRLFLAVGLFACIASEAWWGGLERAAKSAVCGDEPECWSFRRRK